MVFSVAVDIVYSVIFIKTNLPELDELLLLSPNHDSSTSQSVLSEQGHCRKFCATGRKPY